MGPPPRSLAADAHGCIMVRMSRGRPSTSHPTPNTRLWRDRRHPMAGSPQIVLTAQGLSTGRRRLTRGGRAAPARRQPPPNRKTMQVERTVWQNLSLTPRVPYKGWGEGRTPSVDRGHAPHPTPLPVKNGEREQTAYAARLIFISPEHALALQHGCIDQRGAEPRSIHGLVQETITAEGALARR